MKNILGIFERKNTCYGAVTILIVAILLPMAPAFALEVPAGAERILVYQALPDGALIKTDDVGDIYIIKYIGAKKFKRLILDQSILNGYQHLKPGDALRVEKSVFDSFVVSDLVRAAGDDKVYKVYPSGDTGGRRWGRSGEAFIRLDVGKKRWIKTGEVFNRLGFDWDSVFEINNVEEASYSIGVEIY
jgi:hypothetical protein